MTEAIADTARPGHRARLRAFLERNVVVYSILGVIIFNAITLGLSTSTWVVDRMGGFLDVVDKVVLAIFVIEIALKLYAYGLRFFTNAWNVFDLAIVSIGLVPNAEGLSALRGLRVIRALRLLSVMPQMRAVIQALLDAMPGMGAVILMLAIVYYIFSVMATMLYRETHPQWFGTIGESAYSLFQIMTLESWSMGIVRPVMEQHPWAWAFFVPFIVVTAFSVLNLFIGLLVNTMQQAVEAETEAELEDLKKVVKKEIDELDAHVIELKDQVRDLRTDISKLVEIKSG